MERLDADLEAALARQIERKQSAADLSRALDEAAAALRTDEMALFGLQKDLDRAVQEGSACETRREQLARQSAELARSADENEQRLVAAIDGAGGRRARGRGGRGARGRAARARPPRSSDEVDVAIAELTTLEGGGQRRPRSGGRTRARRWSGCAPIAPTKRRARRASRRRWPTTRRAPRRCARTRRSCATRRRCGRPRPRRARGPTASGRARSRSVRRALAEREAQLRAARTEVARLAQTLSQAGDALPGGRAAPDVAGGAGDRSLPRRRAWRASSTTTTCGRCSARERGEARHASCAASSSAWARST